MSLRLRLTLWYSALLAILLALIAVVTLSLVRARFQSEVNVEMQGQGDHIARLLQLRAPGKPLSTVLIPTVGDSFASELYIQVRDLDRRILYRSNNLGNKLIPFPEANQQEALQGKNGFYSLTSDRDSDRETDLLVYFTPIAFGGEIIGTVQVGRSLVAEQTLLRRLAINFFWMAAVVLALGAGVGYWLAGVALRPIQEATTTALEITRTGRLDRRVPVSRTRNDNDEVGTLISTFNEMLARLQELFDKQRRFSGDISHELRTPLTTILGNVGLLKRATGLPAADREEMLGEIESEAQHMRRLVSDLLLLAHADSDHTIAREPVELDTLLLEVYSQAKRRTADRELHLSHEDQAVVKGDADRLRQMLVNLVNNAIQYTPPGGRIDLSLECLGNQAGSQAQITVKDTGQGIAAEDLAHIFDRFYRADKARSRAVGGTGLGLSIVKWIVDAHRGEIDVESTLGAGTTFRVRLPLATPCGNLFPDTAPDAQPEALVA